MAINPLLFPAGMQGLMPTAQPITPSVTPQPMSPQETYLENMRKIAQGDLRSVLTGGDRLMALSGLLKSVARGSRTTPQEAMAQVQQTAANRVGMQMQMAQLEAKARQDAALAANRETIISKLPKDFQEQARAMDPERLGGWLTNLRMQPSYKRVQEDGKWKTKVVYLQSGLTEDAPFELPANLEKGYLGGKAVWFDKDSGLPFTDPTTGQPALAGDPMTPKDMADLALKRQREARMSAPKPRGSGGGGRGGSGRLPTPKYMTVNGKPGWYSWNGRDWVLSSNQNVAAPKAANPFAGILGGGGGGPTFGQ